MFPVKRILLAIVLAASTAASADPVKPAQGNPVLLERVVAVVDDVEIFRSEVLRSVRMDLAQSKAKERVSPAEFEALCREALEKLIDETLIAADAKQHDVRVDGETITRAIQYVARHNELDEAALNAAVAQAGFTPAEYRVAIGR